MLHVCTNVHNMFSTRAYLLVMMVGSADDASSVSYGHANISMRLPGFRILCHIVCVWRKVWIYGFSFEVVKIIMWSKRHRFARSGWELQCILRAKCTHVRYMLLVTVVVLLVYSLLLVFLFVSNAVSIVGTVTVLGMHSCMSKYCHCPVGLNSLAFLLCLSSTGDCLLFFFRYLVLSK